MTVLQVLSLLVISAMAGGYLEKRFGWWSWVEQQVFRLVFWLFKTLTEK